VCVREKERQTERECVCVCLTVCFLAGVLSSRSCLSVSVRMRSNCLRRRHAHPHAPALSRGRQHLRTRPPLPLKAPYRSPLSTSVAEFQSILAFRQQHSQPGAFGRSDLFVLCRLRPLTFQLQPCSEEIRHCRWMTVEELRAQVGNVSSMTVRLTDLVLRGLAEGFEHVDIQLEQHRSLYRGMTFKMFFRPLGAWMTK